MIMNLQKICANATLAAFAVASGMVVAAEPIKIGSVLSVTGPAAFLGDPELKTLQLYVEKINKDGGVSGRPLQLVHYDDASDAGKANGFAKRLIEEDKVDLIVGGTTTGSTMSMVPVVEKAGTPFVSLAGAVVIVEPVKKWVFKTQHTDRIAAEKVFEDMKKRGLTKVALLSETSGF
ncbi:MAG TPA: ABC transporter substrate-binding protein [Rhodocyclaceae bacterium]|nr:ABC transporter substrate-binding protein [Rhodocyclaceae bacterium]